MLVSQQHRHTCHGRIINIVFLNLITFSWIQSKMLKRSSKTIRDCANEHYNWLSYV
jgi:hypothetical protein